MQMVKQTLRIYDLLSGDDGDGMCSCKRKTGPGQGLQAWVGPKPHFNGPHVTGAYVVSDKQGSHLRTLELL